ncbi:MAG: AMP-binding protein [bacterium]
MSLDDPLILEGGNSVARGKISDDAHRLAEYLATRGLGDGDAISVDATPTVAYCTMFMASILHGIRLMPIAPSLPVKLRAERELAVRVRDALSAHELADLVRARHSAPLKRSRTHLNSGGLVIGTSGSGGQPKLVFLPNLALRDAAQSGAARVGFQQGHVWHASLPLHHVGGAMILMRALAGNAAIRLAPPPRRWSDLKGCTHASLVPTQLAGLLDDPSDPPSSLVAILLGGAPSSQSLRDRAVARGVPLYASYGLTESCGQIAACRVQRGDPATLAGPAIGNTEIRIDVEPDSAAGIGEILLEGPVLAEGNYVDGSVVPQAVPFRTRDAGFLDAAGRLHVVGRLDAMFISGGRNIHPETIERALCELSCVRSACVVGVPHAKWGMRPVAFVDLCDAPPQPLATLLAESLERFMIPDTYFALPADEIAAMKPSRARLAARLAAGERFDPL